MSSFLPIRVREEIVLQARTTRASAFALDGMTELPPGKIAAVATYLERRAPPDPMPAPPSIGSFVPLAGNLPRYRALYDGIGQTWLWFSRAALSDRQLAAVIARPGVEALAFVVAGRDLGMIELDFRRPKECELAFLGLLPEATGRGFGRLLIEEAQRRAYARPIGRMWLHTCTLDHHAALPLYLSAGFTPFARAIEVAADPRLLGQMPRDAAAQFPIV